MSNISSLASSSNAMDQMVAQYEATLLGPVTNLQNKVSDLNSRISALSSLKSKLSTLSTTINKLALKGTSSPFLTYAVTTSDSTVATATATSYSQPGTHTLKVNQLASNDMLLSSSVTTAADSGMSANTAYNFTVKVGDADVRTLSVNVSSTSNKDVLVAIASTINADSELAGKISASVINVDGIHSRLVISADDSGASSAITSVGGDFQSLLGLDAIDFTSRTGSTATTAGFARSGAAADALDAKFALDGIDMTREANSIDDALQGVTLTLAGLQKTTDNPLSFTVAVDNDTVKSTIQDFIKNYNDVISYLKTNTSTDATAKTRGILTDDASARSLRNSLRQIIGALVPGVKSGNPQILSDIGLSIARDGTLSLNDSAKLDSILSTDVTKVAGLFSNDAGTGIANQLKSQLDNYTSLGGSLEMTSANYRSQIKSMNDRISSMNVQIDKKGEAYRVQFAQIQVLLQQAASTQSFITTWASTSTG
ncbi:MAG: flagellar filament capping protein FliD [Bacteroidota bacterium]